MSGLAHSDKNAPPFQAIIPGTPQVGGEKGMTHLMAFTNAAADSLPFHEETSILSIFTTQDVWILMKEYGQSDAAAIPANKVKTYAQFIPGGIAAFIGVPRKGDTQHCLSVIRDSADGTLYITEGA
jgi:hypothetical protein